ncbi:MAG: hypothetical protein HY721_13545 [Planctomycetes bacterium]|nr:hypothetical protein [Planctomycetota bacterium]
MRREARTTVPAAAPRGTFGPAFAPPIAVALALSLAVPVAAPLSGCGSAGRRGAGAPLPFTVRVAVAETAGEASSAGGLGPAATPWRLGGGPDALALALARGIDEAGIFSRILTAEDGGAEPDLELEAALRGGDFGPSSVLAGKAALSTLAWLFAGPAAWLIDDRGYPSSDVALDVTIRAAGAARPPIYQDRLLFRDLQLEFLERASGGDYLLSLLLPPWAAAGDPRVAGASLARKALEDFARREPEQVLTRLPALYFETVAAYLLHDGMAREVVIVARRGVQQVAIGWPGGAERSLNPDELALLEVLEPEAKEALWRPHAERAAGIGAGGRFYRVPLSPEERGVVRVRAVLDGGSQAGPWTVVAGGEES